MDATELKRLYATRNSATYGAQKRVRNAVGDALNMLGLPPERVDDFEPMLSNVVYGLVREAFGE